MAPTSRKGECGAKRALRAELCRCATQEALAADSWEGLPANVKQMGKLRLGGRDGLGAHPTGACDRNGRGDAAWGRV
jgi:hypothetical protein